MYGPVGLCKVLNDFVRLKLFQFWNVINHAYHWLCMGLYGYTSLYY